MMTYDLDLFMALVQTFPDSMNLSRVVEIYDDQPGPWGMERVFKGTETITLAGCILDTATATMKTYGKDRALEYIAEFKPARVQRAEMLNFNRNH